MLSQMLSNLPRNILLCCYLPHLIRLNETYGWKQTWMYKILCIFRLLKKAWKYSIWVTHMFLTSYHCSKIQTKTRLNLWKCRAYITVEDQNLANINLYATVWFARHSIAGMYSCLSELVLTTCTNNGYDTVGYDRVTGTLATFFSLLWGLKSITLNTVLTSYQRLCCISLMY